jgi:hypothetical protein
MESRCVVALVVALAMAFAPSAGASLHWVQPSYYGINFQELRNLGPVARAKHLDRIASLGIHQVRLGIAWPKVEPLPPVGGVHHYQWDATDAEIADMAKRRITAQANITQTPRWDAPSGIIDNLNCAKSSSWTPLDTNPYIELTQAIASRYGPGGSFWSSHPGLPRTPIVRYEIWNEPNLRGGWCPNPQPERYADMFVGAARAIRAVDPQAQVVTGGVAPPAKENKHYLSIAHFLGRATAHRPAMTKLATGVAVHIYPSAQPGRQLKRIAWFRDQVRQGGIPNRLPMLVNEIGWAAEGGGSTLTEPERAKAYAAITANMPRTNCNIMGMLPQTWTSAQQSKKNPEDWYGIAGPETANPYPSAHAYAHGIKLMSGQLSVDPPLKPLMACAGMPAPPIPTRGGNGHRPPTASVNLTKPTTRHPRMRLEVNAGSTPVHKASLQLPRGLRFAVDRTWRTGVRARDDFGRLPRSRIHHTKRQLAVLEHSKRGTQSFSVRIGRRALTRRKHSGAGPYRFSVKVVDVDGHRTSIDVG